MKLQILIPQYKEDERIVKKLLDSIELQRNVNFNDIGVIIVNDGSDVILNPFFLQQYKFRIDYIRNEHKGVSATRNKALKEATADYIMFCDADDMFYHSLALQLIIKIIEANKPQCIYSTFIEEVTDKNNKGKFIYNARSHAFVFVHGKIYKRNFLIEKNIWWDEELKLHEDGYFNGLALAQIPQDKLIYCDEPFYMWCDNSNSVSRESVTFILDTYNDNLLAQDKLISKLITINAAEALRLTAIQLYQTYLLLNGMFKEWSEDEKNKLCNHCKVALKAVDNRFAEFYDKFKDCYRYVNQKAREELFLAITNGAKMFNNKNPNLKDFEAWMKEFKKKHNINFDDKAVEEDKNIEEK